MRLREHDELMPAAQELLAKARKQGWEAKVSTQVEALLRDLPPAVREQFQPTFCQLLG